MKINWGSGIAIFYGCFVVIMIFMVIKSSQNQSHLVQENYYQKDLNYEEFRLKRQNGTQIKDQININYKARDKYIQLSFPENMSKATGNIILFRPSNKYLDKSYDIKLDGLAEMKIPMGSAMPGGLWRIQLDWSSQGKNYYIEEDIIL